MDLGCGIGLLTVQLALNATHVCAIDLEKHTVANVLASTFRNGVVGIQSRALTFARGLPRSAKR